MNDEELTNLGETLASVSFGVMDGITGAVKKPDPRMIHLEARLYTRTPEWVFETH
jgi:hypothetical protein